MTPVRYVLVQVLAYTIDYGSFVALYRLDVPPGFANLLSKILAGAVAFQLHRRFTFRVGRDQTGLRRQALWYIALLLLNAPLTSLLLVGFLLFINQPLVAKVLADALAIVVTYTLTKSLVFRQRR